MHCTVCMTYDGLEKGKKGRQEPGRKNASTILRMEGIGVAYVCIGLLRYSIDCMIYMYTDEGLGYVCGHVGMHACIHGLGNK